MAERSHIFIRLDKKKNNCANYIGIYLHWGNPEEIGKTLVKKYNTTDKVMKIMKLGELKCFSKGKPLPFSDARKAQYYNSLMRYFLSNTPFLPTKQVVIDTIPVEIEGDIVTPFKRKKICSYVERFEIKQTLPELKDEYAYLFDGGKWLFFDHQKPLKGWQNLAEYLGEN